MVVARKSGSRSRTPGRARGLSRHKKRRTIVLPGLKDRKLAQGYMGKALEFRPKPAVIALVYGSDLREMRKRKHAVYGALKSAWRIGQKRRDKAGVWTCFGAIKSYLLLRKGSEVRLLTDEAWDAMSAR